MQPLLKPTERSERRRTLGGLLIIGSLVALALLVVSLDELIAGRTPTVELRAVLPETGGLGAGADVWIAGRTVGVVTAVALLPPRHGQPGGVLAVARIPRAYVPMVRTDSRARVTRAGLVGERVLEISAGTRASALLAAGDTIPAAIGAGHLEQTLARARGLLARVDTLSGNMRTIGALYRERRPMIERVAESAALARAEMERTSAALEANPTLGALRDAELSARFGRLRAALDRLQQGLARYTGGELGATVAALDARADSLGAELATLDSLTRDPLLFIGRWRADSAIAVEAARASAQLDSLKREVKRNPFMFF